MPSFMSALAQDLICLVRGSLYATILTMIALHYFGFTATAPSCSIQPLFSQDFDKLEYVKKMHVCFNTLCGFFPEFLALLSLDLEQCSISAELALFTTIVHELIYILIISFFMAICPALGLLRQYKIKRTPAQVPSSQMIHDTLSEGHGNHWVAQPISLFLFFCCCSDHHHVAFPCPKFTVGYKFEGWRIQREYAQFYHDPVSLAPRMMLIFAGYRFCHDLTYFIFHWLFHANRQLYKWFHKQHHQYTGTVVVTGAWASAAEHFFAGLVPTVAFLVLMTTNETLRTELLMRFPPVVQGTIWLVWFAWRVWEAYETHSGYCLDGCWVQKWFGLSHSLRTKWHDKHHSANVGHIGLSPLFDTLFGIGDGNST